MEDEGVYFANGRVLLHKHLWDPHATVPEPWFTVEQLAVDTFAISEYGHWEEVHSYLVLGTKRALLIDSGLGISLSDLSWKR